MVVLLLMGIVLIAVTVRLLIYAAVFPRIKLAMHLRDIQAYSFESMGQVGSVARRESPAEVLASLARRIGLLVMRLVPSLPALQRGDLTAAALYEVSPETMHGYRVMATVLLPVVALPIATGFGSLLGPLILLTTGVAGWLFPAMVIRSRGARRLNEIDRELPDLIDLLTATIEAGMGFAASLDLMATRFKGALGEELRLTQQQQKLGVSNEQALRDMVERCDTGSMRSFVRTLRTAESLGVSIGPSMRELAQDVRRRRRQNAEEKMRKAPIKQLFPLIFLIFPSLLMLVMYPAAYSLIHQLAAAR
jgi:tight adherence protein C